MEEHIRQHIQKLPRYDDKIQYITVTLDTDAAENVVEIIAKCHRADLVAEARHHEMYPCIDEAFARIMRQVKRHHERVVSHKPRDAK